MKHKIILVIFILALLSSVALTISSEKICEDACTSEEKKTYDSFLGIKNAHLGLFVFTLLSLITISHIREPHKHKKKIINIGLIFGAIIALYFLYIQAFVLKEFCKYCLVIDFGMLINLFLIIPRKMKGGNKK